MTCEIIKKCFVGTEAIEYRLCPDRIADPRCGSEYKALLACLYSDCANVWADASADPPPCLEQQQAWMLCPNN